MSSRRTLSCLFTLFVFAASSRLAATADTDAQPLTLSPKALAQLEQIYLEKTTRTAAQKKLATPLVYAVRELKGDKVMREVPRLEYPYKKDKLARIEVDITASVSAGLLEAVEKEGGAIVSAFPQYRSVRAFLPLAAIEALAEREEVSHIQPASQPIVWGRQEKKINTSQGDTAHKAAQARALFGVDGTGVKVGVLSDSVEALAVLQASGDLPAVAVLPGQAGSGTSEGTAMLEIVHDLAPGAQLYFATALGGEATFANNILSLRNQGCKVIVDDVGYFTEPVFQDGIVAQAVESVAASGAAYFSSAGNSGNLSSETAGVWEGDFKSGGSIDLEATAGTLHDFGGGLLLNQLVAGTIPPNPITLQWSDAAGGSANDYDLCALNEAGNTVLTCSVNIQNGTDDNPHESIPSLVGILLAVVNFEGTQQPRFLHLNSNGGRLERTSSGQTSGHSAALNAFSIAAVDVASAGGGAFAGGGANPVENFSSDGPRRIFYNASGSAITPGNFLATGGILRQKPDLSAADGVSTATSANFNPFFGTSAAAPHAAAIAALMFDRNPALSLGGLRSALQTTALDIMQAGVDRNSGYGIIDASEAVEAVAGGGSTTPCVRDADTACLIGGRFEVEVAWQTASTSGAAQVMSFGGQRTENDESVFLWFFAPTNFEMGIKVLNACVPALGNKFWVFVSGLTNQGWVLRVRDSQTGATKTYSNSVGVLSQTFADINAFACP